MKITIKKGHHRPGKWWLLLGFWYNKRYIKRRVIFLYGCNYDLPGEKDDADVNKLFGISYSLDPKKESARFGWKWENGKIWIGWFIHHNHQMEFGKICECPLGFIFDYEIIIGDNTYFFKVTQPSNGLEYIAQIKKEHQRKAAYSLNPWFGGDQPAPHDMEITMERLKA